MQYEALVVSATSSGSVTTLSSKTFNGFVQAARYVVVNASTVLGISSGGGSSLALTAEVSGITVLSLANASSAGQADYYPRAALTDTAGVSTAIGAPIPLYNERLRCVITSGSTTQDTKVATFYLYIT